MAIKSLTVHVTPQDLSWRTAYEFIKIIDKDVGNNDYDVHIDVADVSNNRDTMKTSNVFNGGTVHNQYNNNYQNMN